MLDWPFIAKDYVIPCGLDNLGRTCYLNALLQVTTNLNFNLSFKSSFILIIGCMYKRTIFELSARKNGFSKRRINDKSPL
jgi:ubiquitin C-terminal hydrolase